MSAAQPGLPNGQAKGNGPPKPAANPLRPLRRPRKVDPLVPRKRQPAPKPTGQSHLKPDPTPMASLAASPSPAVDLENLRKQYGGWAEPPPKEKFRDYPVFTTKRALKEGVRFHIMRFGRSKTVEDDKPVDPTDQDEFTRPVTLHRRDPRQPPPGRAVPKEEDIPEPEPVDDKEAERLAQLKAEREAQRAMDQAKIAPVTKDTAPKRQKKQKEEKINFNRMPKTEKGKKESDLRYEEALPWHLEDADGKNVWVGSYVAALSEVNVAFVVEGSGFRMVPLEKWYKFTAKPPFIPYTAEQAEQLMKTHTGGVNRWIMKHNEKKEEMNKQLREYRNFIRGAPPSSKGRRPVGGQFEVREYDEVDMEGEEFQDDDENPGFELDDEEARLASERIRQNQLGANLFGEGDEREVDEQELHETKAEMMKRNTAKGLKKTLVKRENNNEIESDDSLSNPFDSSSSSDDESGEEEDQSQAKTEEEKAKGDAGERVPSGVSSKGPGTPSGKPKLAEGAKKGKGLKRPGSPNLSESSGNESFLKKGDKRALSSTGQSRSTTPLPQGQSLAAHAGQRRKINAGSTSDGEATGGEMSDGQPRKKKIKLVGTGGAGTPGGSRSGSPMPGLAVGSASTSPVKDGRATPRAASPGATVEPWEIVAALPPLPGGISVGNLLKMFQDRIGEDGVKMPKSEWLKLLKENCAYGADKLLRRKS